MAESAEGECARPIQQKAIQQEEHIAAGRSILASSGTA
jgi:hypothetical protein